MIDSVDVEVTRGDRVESIHAVDVAVLAADGTVIAATAGADQPAFARSAVKPIQALPLVVDGAVDGFGLTDRELALCCASHSGEERHVAVARSILSRVGVTEDALACGPHAPLGEEAAARLLRSGTEAGRIHNNCSGKHAGMLALARHRGWPVDGYHRAGHPVQDRMHEEVARWTGLDRATMETGVDGCGVVTFALAPTVLARAFAGLAREARHEGSGPARVLGAMAAYPEMVGGGGRLCTAVIERTGGRVVAKTGAEGVYVAAIRDRDWGLALKVRDGARRASESALVGVLGALGLLTDDERAALSAWGRRPVTNTRDERVGEIRPRVRLRANGMVAL